MFIILPVGVDYQARRYPVVTFTLMGLCVAIYLTTFICRVSGDSEGVDDWVFTHLWLIPSESHWWTYLTQMFLHGGFFHVAGNMIYLFLFGSCVEDAIGRVRYIIFYLLCGVASALAYILMSPEHFASDIPMGGASGAISGCIGGFLMLMASTKIEFKWLIFFMFRLWHGEFMLPAWLVISFWFLGDVAQMVLSNMANMQGGVAFGAHVGGTAFGLGLMAFERVRLKREGFFDEPEYEPIATPARPVVQPAARARPQSRPAAIASAVTEAPTISLFWNETHYGPFTPAQIHEMFVNGTIPAEALYWQEGMEEWRTAEELREPGTG